MGETDENIFKGCRIRMATCRKEGPFMRRFKLEHIGAQVAAALQPMK